MYYRNKVFLILIQDKGYFVRQWNDNTDKSQYLINTFLKYLEHTSPPLRIILAISSHHIH